jgi:SAM-dependent methyltransferase
MPAPPWSSWEKWLQSPPGRYVLRWEQQCFDQIVADVFGFHALQIGLPQMNALSENRMPLHALFIHANDNLEYASRFNWHLIEGNTSELPFANESLDLVVLPHVLEFAADPHQILREVDRILRPEGRLVISGFNPASLWGARQYLSRLIGNPFLPRDGQFISLIRVKDWLQLLNYSLDRGHFGCYKFPLHGESSMSRMEFLESMGNRWWPIFGAVFLVSAIKRHKGMRLIGQVQPVRIPAITQLSPAAERNQLRDSLKNSQKQ